MRSFLKKLMAMCVEVQEEEDIVIIVCDEEHV